MQFPIDNTDKVAMENILIYVGGMLGIFLLIYAGCSHRPPSLLKDNPMSTKKEKCNGTKAEWLLEFENMVKDNSFVTPSSHLNVLAIQDFISKAITTAVAKDRELGNPYNSVSTWKEIGKNRGYWGFFNKLYGKYTRRWHKKGL